VEVNRRALRVQHEMNKLNDHAQQYLQAIPSPEVAEIGNQQSEKEDWLDEGLELCFDLQIFLADFAAIRKRPQQGRSLRNSGHLIDSRKIISAESKRARSTTTLSSLIDYE